MEAPCLPGCKGAEIKLLVVGEWKGQAELSGAVFTWWDRGWVGVEISGHQSGKIFDIS